MYNKERVERIMQILRQNGSVSVNELAEIFQVSGATIRTDLAKMDKAGMLTRTHGGAIMNSPVLRETLLTERMHTDKKRLIAQRALQFIHERSIILMDTGTTMAALAQALVQSRLEELTVFTNDLEVIRILEEKENFTLTLLGGKVRNRFHYCYGSSLQQELADYHFSTVFLATSALHEVYGLTTENIELANIKSEMVRTADKVILLADSSKMGNVQLRKFASLSEIDTLIMDDGLSAEDREKLRSAVGNLILV